RVQDQLLRRRAVRDDTRGDHAPASWQADYGVADASHRRRRAPAVPHNPDPNGADLREEAQPCRYCPDMIAIFTRMEPRFPGRGESCIRPALVLQGRSQGSPLLKGHRQLQTALSHRRKPQEIGHAELSIWTSTELVRLGVPGRLDPQVGHRVPVQQTDEHLRDNAAADRAELLSLTLHLSLLEDIEPQGRILTELRC